MLCGVTVCGSGNSAAFKWLEEMLDLAQDIVFQDTAHLANDSHYS